MSIEKSLDRIATALETIAAAKQAPVAEAPKPASPEPAAAAPSTPVTTAPPAPAPQAPVAAPVTAAPTTPPPAATPAAAPQAPAPAVATMTVEQLNGHLVQEFARLGNNREPIDNALRELGAANVTELAPEHYQTLLDKVRAL